MARQSVLCHTSLAITSSLHSKLPFADLSLIIMNTTKLDAFQGEFLLLFPLSLVGMDNFEALLAGAHAMVSTIRCS